MRKLWIALAGAAMFALSAGAASTAGAVPPPIKTTEPPLEEVSFVFQKIDVPYASGKVYTAGACRADGGTVFKREGQDTCKIPRRGHPTAGSTRAPGGEHALGGPDTTTR